jgi:PTS system fructose-specific IIC component
MKICDLLSLPTIKLDLKAKKKEEAIDELVDLLYKAGKVTSREEFKEAIVARESISSTALEEGIAIPHAKTAAVKEPALAFGLSKEGLDYESLDGEPSTLFFMIAAPEKASDEHIETLSTLTTMLLDDDFREELLNTTSAQQVLDIINQRESEKKGEEEVIGNKKSNRSNSMPYRNRSYLHGRRSS